MTLTSSQLSLGNEDFFTYCLRVKGLHLSHHDSQACCAFVADQRQRPLTPYVETLHQIFSKQIELRLGSAVQAISEDSFKRKVTKLVRLFLKDKLSLRKPINPEFELAAQARWDPHFHANSLFVTYFPEARFYLPNFDQACSYLKEKHRALIHRAELVKKVMEKCSFSEITENSCGYDNWQIEHCNKKIIPILSHQRTAGAVERRDVTGYDLSGLEEEDHYHSQAAFFDSLSKSHVVRVHIGETYLAENGKHCIASLLDEAEKYYKSSKPLRLGHVSHISIKDMLRVSNKGYYIEVCLSSNKRTGIIDKRSDYPLGIMLLLGIKVVIGTDGGDLYNTTLATEYAYAVRNLKKFKEKIRTSNDPILLPNGDHLCFRHISIKVGKEKQSAVETRAEKAVTYKDLELFVTQEILEGISKEVLVHNARTLLQECYPNG